MATTCIFTHNVNGDLHGSPTLRLKWWETKKWKRKQTQPSTWLSALTHFSSKKYHSNSHFPFLKHSYLSLHYCLILAQRNKRKSLFLPLCVAGLLSLCPFFCLSSSNPFLDFIILFIAKGRRSSRQLTQMEQHGHSVLKAVA